MEGARNKKFKGRKGLKKKGPNKRQQAAAEAEEQSKTEKEKMLKEISRMSTGELHLFRQNMTGKLLKMCLKNPKFRDRAAEFMPELPEKRRGYVDTSTGGEVEVVTFNAADGSKEGEGLTMAELQEKRAEERVKEQRRILKDGLKALAKKDKKPKVRKTKEERKEAPEEIPISREVNNSVRLVVQNKRAKPRDPRFVGLNRDFSEGTRKWWNNFLAEKEKEELKSIKKDRRNAVDDEEKKELKSKQHQIKSHEFTLAREEERKKVRMEYKRKQIERMKEGKKPLFLTRKRENLLYTMQQYQKLKEIGKLDTYLQRKERRKRNKDKAM